jgi:hypothetical protein
MDAGQEYCSTDCPAILILANFYEGLSWGVRKARVSRSWFHDEKRKKTVRERK